MIYYPLSLSECLIQIKWYLKIEPKIINSQNDYLLISLVPRSMYYMIIVSDIL